MTETFVFPIICSAHNQNSIIIFKCLDCVLYLLFCPRPPSTRYGDSCTRAGVVAYRPLWIWRTFENRTERPTHFVNSPQQQHRKGDSVNDLQYCGNDMFPREMGLSFLVTTIPLLPSRFASSSSFFAHAFLFKMELKMAFH